MDILNFISWIKGSRLVSTVDPQKTLIPLGVKTNRRDEIKLLWKSEFTHNIKVKRLKNK